VPQFLQLPHSRILHAPMLDAFIDQRRKDLGAVLIEAISAIDKHEGGFEEVPVDAVLLLITGGGPRCRCPRWWESPKPTACRSLWVWRAAKPYGRSRRCATSRSNCPRRPPSERRTVPEIVEPHVALRAMTAGGKVVEDYRHVGLSLRRHPVTFPRDDLPARRIVTCAEAMAARYVRWLTAAGLVLVRQKLGSAKVVMFVTIEDESGVANLVIWPSLYERERRIILGVSMIAVKGRVQRARGRSGPSGRQSPDGPVGRPRRRRRSRRRVPIAAGRETNSIMAVREKVRAACRPRDCGPATSTFRISTSTPSR
jgi:hypothetical protein